MVAPEYRNPRVGRPDIALVRQGAPARAFVELKAPARPADPARWRDAHDKCQHARLRELACWASSNFAELRLFHRAEPAGAAAIVPERCLRPDRDDARADLEIDAHDSGAFMRLVEMLVVGAGQARDAKHLATLLAHSARLVRRVG